MAVLKPFEHDCENCIWVGWVYFGDRWGNMYHCPLIKEPRDI